MSVQPDRAGDAVHRQPSTMAAKPFNDVVADEISLVDLAAVLFRRRYLVCAVVAIAAVCGLAKALLKAPTYHFTSPLFLATTLRVAPNGGSTPQIVESPSDLATRLREVIIPSARRALAERNHVEIGAIPDVESKALKEEKQLLLSSRATEEQHQIVRALHEEVVTQLRRSQAPLLSSARDQYETHLHLTELKLNELKDPAVYAAKQLEKQNAIKKSEIEMSGLNDSKMLEEKSLRARLTEIRHKIDSLDDQETVVRSKIASIGETKTLLNKEIQEIAQAMATVRDRQAQVENQAGNGVDALGVLLVRSQLLQYQQRYTNLEERLTMTLPAERSALEKQLSDIARDRVSAREELAVQQLHLSNMRAKYARETQTLELKIKQQKGDYDRFVTDYQRARNEQEQRVLESKAIGEQIRPTSAIEFAVQSADPIGPGKKVIVVLSLIFGLIAAVFLAFVAEFLSKVKLASAANRASESQDSVRVGPYPVSGPPSLSD